MKPIDPLNDYGYRTYIRRYSWLWPRSINQAPWLFDEALLLITDVPFGKVEDQIDELKQFVDYTLFEPISNKVVPPPERVFT